MSEENVRNIDWILGLTYLLAGDITKSGSDSRRVPEVAAPSVAEFITMAASSISVEELRTHLGLIGVNVDVSNVDGKRALEMKHVGHQAVKIKYFISPAFEPGPVPIPVVPASKKATV